MLLNGSHSAAAALAKPEACTGPKHCFFGSVTNFLCDNVIPLTIGVAFVAAAGYCYYNTTKPGAKDEKPKSISAAPAPSAPASTYAL